MLPLIKAAPDLWPSFSILSRFNDLNESWNDINKLLGSIFAFFYYGWDAVGRRRREFFHRIAEGQASITCIGCEFEELVEHTYTLSAFKVLEKGCKTPTQLIELGHQFLLGHNASREGNSPGGGAESTKSTASRRRLLRKFPSESLCAIPQLPAKKLACENDVRCAGLDVETRGI